MREIWKKLVMILAIAAMTGMLTLPISAEETTSGTIGKNGQLTWTISDQTLTISGNDEMEDFYGAWTGDYSNSVDTPWAESAQTPSSEYITKVVVKSGVQNVGAFAFAGLTHVTTVILEDGITTIGEGAFAEKSINSITFPSTLKTIGRRAFSRAIGSIVISLPEGLVSIGEEAFQSSSLTEVTLPDSLLTMGEGAFQHCLRLEKVVLGQKLQSIPDAAFYCCRALKALNIPQSVQSIGKNACLDCNALESVTIPDGVVSIGASAFSNCWELTAVTIPGSVLTLGQDAFNGCQKLSDVILYEGLQTLWGGAFDFTAVTDLAFPKSITKLNLGTKDRMFTGLEKLTTILLPATPILYTSSRVITSYDGSEMVSSRVYDASLFYGCPNLEEVIVPEGVKYIGAGAFVDLEGLTTLTLPDSLSRLGASCLPKTLHLTKLPENLRRIDEYVFEGNPTITTIELPDRLEYIGEGAFRHSGLVGINIPASVERIGSGAFSQCENLTYVHFAASWSGTIAENAFCENPELTAFLYPNGIERAVESFYDCPKLRSIYIPASVTYMNTLDASSVTDIYYGGSWDTWKEIINSQWIAESPTSISTNINGDTFTMHMNHVRRDYVNKQMDAAAEEYYSTVNLRRFTIVDPDNVGVNQPTGFLISYSGGSISTGSKNSVSLKLTPEVLAEGITVTKEGYFDCTVPGDYLYNDNVIRMYRKDSYDEPFVQTAMIREHDGDKARDALSQSVTLCKGTRLDSREESRTFDLYLNIKWNGYTPKAVYLYQSQDGEAKQYQVYDGVEMQDIPWEDFLESGYPVYIRMCTTDNHVFSQKINLTILPFEKLNVNLKLGIKDSLSTPEVTYDILPELSDWSLKSDLEDFTDLPVKYEVFPDGTVKGTIGIEGKNGESVETVWQYCRESSVVDGSLVDYYKRYGLTPHTSLTSCVISGKMELVGTFTGKVNDSGILEITEIETKVQFSASESKTHVYIETQIPSYLKLSIKAAFAAAVTFVNENAAEEGETHENYTEPNFVVDEGLNFSFSVSVTPEGGVGVPDFLSLGVQAANKIEATWKYEDRVDGGPDYWYSIQINLSYSALIFSNEVPLTNENKILLFRDGNWVGKTEEEVLQEESLVNQPTLDTASLQAFMDYYDDPAEEQAVFSNAYYYAAPQIVQLDEEKLLAVWVGEDTWNRTGANRPLLMYSIYDGESWSEKSCISNDGLADMNPCLYAEDGKAYLVWTKAAEEIGTEADTLEEVFSVMDVAYACYEDGAWSEIARICTTEGADLSPKITLVNGTPTVVWYHGPFYGCGQTIMTAVLDGNTWTASQLVADLDYLDSLAICSQEDCCSVAYCCGDTQPENPHTVYTCTVEDGEETKLAENAEQVQSDGTRFWWIDAQANAICSSTGDRIANDGLISSYAAAEDAVFILSVGSEGKSRLSASYRTAEGMCAVALVKEVDSGMNSLRAVKNGSVYSVMSARPAVNYDTISSNIFLLCAHPGINLSADNASYESCGMKKGAALPVSVRVSNHGTAAAEYCDISVSSYGNILATDRVYLGLEPGEETYVYLSVPNYNGQDCLSIQVLPMQAVNETELFAELESVEDTDTTDNLTSVTIRLCDVSVENTLAEVYQTEDGEARVRVSAMVIARGVASSYLSCVKLNDAENTLLAESTQWADGEEIYYLNAGDAKEVLFDLPMSQVGEGALLYVEAEVDESRAEQENILSNNSAMAIAHTLQSTPIEEDYNYCTVEITDNGDGTVAISYSITNPDQTALKLRLCAAAYEGNGCQYAVEQSECLSIAVGETESGVMLLSCPADGSVKYFLLDADTMEPITA